jgi:hypothetical protein
MCLRFGNFFSAFHFSIVRFRAPRKRKEASRGWSSFSPSNRESRYSTSVARLRAASTVFPRRLFYRGFDVSESYLAAVRNRFDEPSGFGVCSVPLDSKTQPCAQTARLNELIENLAAARVTPMTVMHRKVTGRRPQPVEEHA